MKRNCLMKLVAASLVMMGIGTNVDAQVEVNADGGVRMGTALRVSSSSPWDLSSGGLEVNLGEMLFHTTGGGYISITGQKASSKSSTLIPIDPPVSPDPTPLFLYESIITGTGINIGSSSSPIKVLHAVTLNYTSGLNKTSDLRMKEKIQPISNAKDIVMRLRPVTYDLKPWEGFWGDSSILKNKAGFIAQEVLDVLPEAVSYDEEIDQYSLDYIHFIPYLTQTIQVQEKQKQVQEQRIQEQERTIAELQNRLEYMEEMMETLLPKQNSQMRIPVSATETVSSETTACLYQNQPNPFSESTRISYVLPEKADPARIVIYSSVGKKVRSYALPNMQGQGEITVEGHTLTPGVYIYSLVVGGRTLDSKKMTVTE